ncbi:MAG: PQQ-binding-like beta-propeller repeat protein [Deltaproteobacteria bacterium]|nr:PQQ-binding-like beta-propeller repeat protein [Deltaproteobacteria bacterium]
MARGRAIRIGLLLLLLPLGAAYARDLEPNPPDEVILRKGKGNDVLWSLPLGPAIVDDMRLIAPGMLLVSLREDRAGLPNLDLLLVESASGKLLWRFDRSGTKGTFRPLYFTEEAIAYVVEERKQGTLLLLDARTGKARWSVPLSGPDPFAIPSPDASDILVAETREKKGVLSLRSGKTGEARWSVFSREAGAPDMVQNPIFFTEGLLHFFDGVTRIDPGSGAEIWSRPDLYVSRFDPPPEVTEGRILVVASRSLHSIEPAGGKTRWKTALPDMNVSNIFTLENRVFLRGSPRGSQGNIISCLGADDGKVLWTTSGPEPAVSNILPFGDRIFLATGTSVVALSAETGRELFRTAVTNTGKTFPVRLVPYPGRVIFIGELAIAAVDPATGKRLWFRGMNPVSNEANLSSLDASIPRLKQEAGELSGVDVDYGSSFAFQLLKQYQADTARYGRKYSEARSRGNYWDMKKADVGGRISSAAENMQATMAFCMSALELAQKLKLLLEAREMGDMRARQELLRRSILTGYAGAEGEGWILRPDRKWKSVADDFIGATLVRLPEGEQRFIPLSPAYLSYGLWNVYDEAQEILVHHGIGLDPKAYRYAEPRAMPPYGKIGVIETSLTAVRAAPAR